MAQSTRPGDVLAGRYRLVDLLSESGSGRFWRAHDLVLERPVALHVLAEDDERAQPLLDAASLSAQVLDARILRVLDADHRDGLCYVVNEWGTGISLDILVRQTGPLGPRRSAWLTADVAGAIARAHAAGVVHGRLNPENVLIDRYGAVRLIGLCVDAALHGITGSDEATDRADLAGLLYCALTATWPGPSTSAVAAAPVAHGEVLSPRRVRAGVPRPLDQLWLDLTAHRSGEGRLRWASSASADLETVPAIQQRLLDFLGDPTGLPEALAASVPPVNEVRPVVLPTVDDPLPHERDDTDGIPTVRPVAQAQAAPERSAGESAAAADPPATQRIATLTASSPKPGPAPDGDEPETRLVDADAEADDEDDDEDLDVAADAEPEADARSDADADTDGTAAPAVVDLPTEAGMPVFGDGDDVAWLRARATPPPPPPPFEEPPERPLFAPDPVRRPRDDVPRPAPVSMPPPPPAEGKEYWPWTADTDGFGPATGEIGEDDAVPGRSWLRLAMGISAALLLLLAVIVAFNLGRGRTPLGAEPDPTPSRSASSPAAAPVRQLTGLTASDLDPFGDDEHPDEVSNAIDGDPASTWPTDTYEQQFGPGGLKPGVGLVLDLGDAATVHSADLTFLGAPTTVRMYVTDTAPTGAPTGDPVAEVEATGPTASLEPEEPVDGRYVLLWITSLPEVSGGYRAELAEVVVRGD
ncbi:hypothetical protein HNR19_004275 [Nocardioides thalensis]|uniref:non-specific serine/threonine protein kinase n=1 Tax=Nocardioides thalensis TaxID=1914755 RepID=A0A853C8D5_9ACTN|nr:protein kinase family protein [Nocardioides thalensis]NYJ03577.1 hypothetical protein [Nocardioides thalensis]